MGARDHLADLLCHHGEDEAGHQLGDACPVQVKTSTRVGWPAIRTYGGGYGTTAPMPLPSGTCPDCGSTGVKVRIRTLCTAAAGRDLMPGVKVADVPELAAHKRPGRGAGQCAGGGRPAETRWSFPQLDAIVRDYGPGAVA